MNLPNVLNGSSFMPPSVSFRLAACQVIVPRAASRDPGTAVALLISPSCSAFLGTCYRMGTLKSLYSTPGTDGKTKADSELLRETDKATAAALAAQRGVKEPVAVSAPAPAEPAAPEKVHASLNGVVSPPIANAIQKYKKTHAGMTINVSIASRGIIAYGK